jgi:hypothetical protein
LEGEGVVDGEEGFPGARRAFAARLSTTCINGRSDLVAVRDAEQRFLQTYG